jgi:chemotaxis response regulator CheB
LVIRVLIVGDQSALRAGFAALLGGEDDMEVVGEAADSREAVDPRPPIVADTLLAGHDHFTLTTAAAVQLVAVPVLAAEALRNRRSYVQLLLEQLELAERTREQEAERRAEQERLRRS